MNDIVMLIDLHTRLFKKKNTRTAIPLSSSLCTKTFHIKKKTNKLDDWVFINLLSVQLVKISILNRVVISYTNFFFKFSPLFKNYQSVTHVLSQYKFTFFFLILWLQWVGVCVGEDNKVLIFTRSLAWNSTKIKVQL